LYHHKKNVEFSPPTDDPDDDGNADVPFQEWYRYIVYGASLNYAMDFSYEDGEIANIEKGYNKERNLNLARMHNQIKIGRCLPRC